MRPNHLLLLLLLPAGCSLQQDPLKQPGTWSPVGANDANLRVMVANPADLAGRPVMTGTAAALPVGAIDRMLADKIKPLPNLETSDIGAGGGSSAGQ